MKGCMQNKGKVEMVSRLGCRWRIGSALIVVTGAVAACIAVPISGAERDHRGGSAWSAPRTVRPTGPAGVQPHIVDRSVHGSVRHAENHVIRRPAQVYRAPEHRRDFRHDVFVHRDVDVDIHRPHYWNRFAYGRHSRVLPFGFLTLSVGGLPFYYYNGIYYQPSGGEYIEVYPPMGAAVPEPPDGSVQVVAGGQVYYYAGGAFYVQRPDGTFAVAPPPMGVLVPELPPGAVQVSVGGQIAFQFNGIYYRPVFVNGVTQYQTFIPPTGY